MSAPTIDRRPTRVREAPGRGTLAPPRIPAQRTAEQTGRRAGTAARERTNAASARRAQVQAGRAKFVLVVMTLLVCGLVATLWLSTAAAADSYRLQEARTRAGTLTEQSEQLRKQVTAMNAPGALAERAEAQGLVPVQDPARLVVAPDGRVDVVGEPTEARAGSSQPPATTGPTAPTVPVQPTPVQPGQQAPAQQVVNQVPQAATADPDAAAGATTAGQAGGNG